MAEKQLTNPLGAFGYTGLQDTLGPRVEATFVAAGTITAGRCVTIGTDGTISQAAASASTPAGALTCGVAVNSAVAGGTVTVVVYGLVDTVAQGTVTAGNLVTRSATVSGSVASAGTTIASTVFGTAITTASDGGTVTIWVGLRG